MRIKLIQPKMQKRPMDTDLKLRMAPPLGLLTIVNLLRDSHTITLENENIEPINYDDPVDLVGISITVDVLPRAMEIASHFRACGIPVVAGGIHVTTAYHTIPPDAFDVLCIGAAEGTWPFIVSDLEKGRLQKIYRCRQSVTGRDIVSPAYDFVDRRKYLYCNVVHTSRGCPYRCDFCYNSASERRYVNREIDAVLEDIRAVRSRHIMFIDDNFAGNPEWTRTFLQAIAPMKLKWNAAVSLNTVREPELLDLMKESGCQGLFIGLESISPQSIGTVHKTHNRIEEYEDIIRQIHQRGIMVNASFVFGLDGDTPETFRQTLDWIVKNKIETVTSHILTPYPGTVLYDRMEREGRILTKDYSKYNTAHVVFQPLHMTEQELYDGYLYMYRQIYSLPNILKRIPERKEQRAAYLMFNLVYRKFGKITDYICKCVTYKKIGILAEKISHYL